jgi:hypothetical protein
MDGVCPYAELGLTPKAEQEVIDAAYRALCLKHHPDKGGSPDRFRRVQMARKAISAGTRLPAPPRTDPALASHLSSLAQAFRKKKGGGAQPGSP